MESKNNWAYGHVSREVKNIKVALHIHVFYIELLEDILERLDFNKSGQIIY